MSWKHIETAPKDRIILLYWPAYAYNIDEDPQSVIGIGSWKQNTRLQRHYADLRARLSEEQYAKLDPRGSAPAYFADTDEEDDYGLSLPKHAPTHWMELPPPPTE